MQLKRDLRNVLALSCALSVIVGSSLRAQEVYSQIVGAIAIDLPAESDVIVSAPFKQGTAFKGSIDTSSVVATVNLHLSVDGDPFTANQFQTAPSGFYSHYLLLETGALKGLWSVIASNTTSTIVIETDDDVSDAQAAITQGDEFSIFSSWSLDAAFPSGVASTEESEPGLRTVELIVPEFDSPAGGMVAESIFFYSGGAWRQFGKPLDWDAGPSFIAPDQAFVIRNNGDADKTAYFFGEVSTAPIAIELSVNAGQDTDHFVGLGRPLDLTLNELGLHDNPSVFSADDRLLVYSLDESGKNKAPVAEYSYDGSWIDVTGGGSAAVDGDSVSIAVNMGIGIRKKAGAEDDVFWINEWSLPQ